VDLLRVDEVNRFGLNGISLNIPDVLGCLCVKIDGID
jgi:hypothetical protein